MTKRTIRCLSPALLAVAILLLGTTTALAQHTTGFDMEKTCPNVVQSGESFFCTVTIANNDTQHRVGALVVTNEAPFPAGEPVAVECFQPFDPAACPTGQTGTSVTILGVAGAPDASCGACLPETAPNNCGTTNLTFTDQVHASGTDEGIGGDPGHAGEPADTTTTNSVGVAPLVCEDNNACTTDTCDVALGCVFSPIVCNDNNACTTDTCDPVLGCTTTPIVCDDNNACTTDTCDPVLGCQTTPIVCDDNNACTTDACDPVLGCVTTAIDCNDNNACTTDTCDPVLGCQTTPIDCNDNNTCTTDTCDPVLGCVNEAISCDDNNACTTDVCDPVTGCSSTPISCDDNNACTTETCDPVTGCTTPEPIVCDDNDICTDDECVEGQCVFTPDPTNDPSCVADEEICRTPGFFGTHAGEEKEGRSEDITGAILGAFNDVNDPDLTICGAVIATSDDAIQAICISPKGNSELQLARQLTAAALNCIVSNSGSDDVCVPLTDTAGVPCGGTSIEAIWNACNAECDNDGDVTVDVDLGAGTVAVSCIAALDCFNNGFVLDPATGECTDELSGCHERPLDENCPDFDFLPAAGSPRECAAARKDDVDIFNP